MPSSAGEPPRPELVLVLPGAHPSPAKIPPPDISVIRAAIENYVPSVRPDNTTALGIAVSAIATYLNDMHNLIHPVFADEFLSSLDGLPASDPLNNWTLHSEIEVVIGGSTGELVRAGLVRSSGVLQFDISALLSVHRAAPFDEVPIQFRSPDGNAYVHWEFYRNPDYACSTYFAHPFLLKVAGQGASDLRRPMHPGQQHRTRLGQRYTEVATQHLHRAVEANGFESLLQAAYHLSRK